MNRIRVMLTDDHELMRQGLRALLQDEENIEVMGEAGSGEALLREIEQGAKPDIVLMDIQMRGMSGIEATKQLKQRLPQTHVIGLTAVEEDTTIIEMLQAGACSYLIKSMAATDLIKAICSAYNDAPWLPTDIQRRLQRHITFKHTLPTTFRSKPIIDLTRRELDVVKTLLEGYSNKEIARRLFISERTVQTHLSNIFTKMNVTSRTEVVLVAMRDGWLAQH